MKQFLLFSLLIFFSANTRLTAQSIARSTEVLATVRQSPAARAAEEKLNFLRTKDFSLPLLEKGELRTETEDFDLKQQNFALRVTPNTRRQMRAQDSYHESLIRLTELENREALPELLEKKYRLLIDYKRLSNRILHLDILHTIYRKRRQILRGQVTTPDFDLNELVKNEENFFETETDILESEQKFAALKNTLRTELNADSLTVDFADIETLLLRVENAALAPGIASEKLRLRLAVTQAELEIERAEIANPIDFIGAEYGFNRNEFQRDFSVGASFFLPIKGKQRIDLAELEYEKTERIADFQTDSITRVNRIANLVNELKNATEMYRLRKTQLTDNQTDFALRQLLKMSDADPLQILRLREISLRRRMDLHRLEAKIYEIYVEWLAESEEIIALPLRNRLGAEEESF